MSRYDKAPVGRVVAFGILSLAMAAFIWSNSLLDGTASGAQSGYWAAILKPILDPFAKMDTAAFHSWLRKAAHFTEFAVLGYLVGVFSGYLGVLRNKIYIPLPLLLTLLVAVSDEFIQRFTGRGSSVSDVVLDYTGAVTALGVLWLVRLIKQKFK